MQKQEVLHILYVCVCVCVCVYSLIYPACKMHASYSIVICGPSGSTIFLTDHLKNIIIFVRDLLYIKCVFWSLHFLSETFLIIRRIQCDIIKMYIGLNVKYQLFLSDFKQHWIFPIRVSKKNQLSNLMKIHPVGAELFHLDRQTWWS